MEPWAPSKRYSMPRGCGLPDFQDVYWWSLMTMLDHSSFLARRSFQSFLRRHRSIVDRGSRRQLPLVLGCAMTIPKSQGFTLNKAVIDVRDDEIAIGIAYVGCSSVRSVGNLALLSSFPFERMQRLNNSVRLRLVTEEVQKLAKF